MLQESPRSVRCLPVLGLYRIVSYRSLSILGLPLWPQRPELPPLELNVLLGAVHVEEEIKLRMLNAHLMRTNSGEQQQAPARALPALLRTHVSSVSDGKNQKSVPRPTRRTMPRPAPFAFRAQRAF